MTTIDSLRSLGTTRIEITTADGLVTGYLNQALLTDRAAFALVGVEPSTSADNATVVAVDAITAVKAAT